MQALQTQAPGGWEHTSCEEVPEPSPADQEALVDLKAAALNPADAFLIEGSYPGGPQPPFVAGRDGAGIVIHPDSLGRWSAGQRVVVLQSRTTDLARGTFCERQCISSDNLAPLPDGWSFAEGAAAPLVFQTAWKALVERGRLQAGQVVVITGASGGVGLAAVQLAWALGAEVVACSRSAEKRNRLLQLGAQHAFSPDEPDLKQQVFAAVGRKGVDLVVENVGGSSLGTSVHLLGENGRVCVVGMLGGVEGSIPIPSLLFKRGEIHGILVTEDPPELAQAAWNGILEALAHPAPRQPGGSSPSVEAGVRPVIDSRYRLTEFSEAFRQLRSDVFGKIVFDLS